MTDAFNEIIRSFDQHTTIDGEQACILGCINRGEHQPDCPCHDQCPDHTDHCSGCAPRPSHENSLLCGHCFYVKLKAPLRRVPALFDWYTSRKAGLRAAVYDSDRITVSKDQPLPFNVDITDHLDLMRVVLATWAHRSAELAPPGPGPDGKDAVTSAKWLEDHASWISEQQLVGQLSKHLRQLEDYGRAIAPWQATRHKLPLPCFKCQQPTLVLFGGEDWVTCTSPGCDEIIGWFRYQRLSESIGNLLKNEGKAG